MRYVFPPSTPENYVASKPFHNYAIKGSILKMFFLLNLAALYSIHTLYIPVFIFQYLYPFYMLEVQRYFLYMFYYHLNGKWR